MNWWVPPGFRRGQPTLRPMRLVRIILVHAGDVAAPAGVVVLDQLLCRGAAGAGDREQIVEKMGLVLAGGVAPPPPRQTLPGDLQPFPPRIAPPADSGRLFAPRAPPPPP